MAERSIETGLTRAGDSPVADLRRTRQVARTPRKPVGLALQGGGSWGAYTWGVLDSVLASRTLSVTQLSGTSAGAINAAIVASALANGSPAQARKALRSFWLSIAAPHAPEVVRDLFENAAFGAR